MYSLTVISLETFNHIVQRICLTIQIIIKKTFIGIEDLGTDPLSILHGPVNLCQSCISFPVVFHNPGIRLEWWPRRRHETWQSVQLWNYILADDNACVSQDRLLYSQPFCVKRKLMYWNLRETELSCIVGSSLGQWQHYEYSIIFSLVWFTPKPYTFVLINGLVLIVFTAHRYSRV